MAQRCEQPVQSISQHFHEPSLYHGDRRQPAARKHVALSGAQFHHCASGNFPQSQLAREKATTMANPFVAEIRIFAGNFAPTGWALCDGQLLPISQNTALFSLLGTFYGGDGKSTFALPNLDGSVPLGQGQLKGGSEYFLGQSSGTDTVTLITTEMPIHNHFVTAYV